MGFDAEGHCVTVADVNDTSVLTDTGKNLRRHFLSGGLAKVAQVGLGRLVRAVLRPHHGVNRQLSIGWAAAQDAYNLVVFVLL